VADVIVFADAPCEARGTHGRRHASTAGVGWQDERGSRGEQQRAEEERSARAHGYFTRIWAFTRSLTSEAASDCAALAASCTLKVLELPLQTSASGVVRVL
jgi:hypothetical protein